MDRVVFHEYGAQLRLAPDDSLILNVLCGRIGEFGVEFTLDTEELDEYRNRGDEFVNQAAHCSERL